MVVFKRFTSVRLPGSRKAAVGREHRKDGPLDDNQLTFNLATPLEADFVGSLPLYMWFPPVALTDRYQYSLFLVVSSLFPCTLWLFVSCIPGFMPSVAFSAQ